MRTMTNLPQGYAQKDYVNLSARTANSISFLLCVGLLALGWQWRGFDALSALQWAGIVYYALFALALVAAVLAFSWLHQLTHALLLRLCTGVSPLYARKGVRLFVGTSAYLCRRDAMLVLLLPALVWTAVGAAVCALTEGLWFWLAMTSLLANLGSGAEDVYYAVCTLRAPKNALIQYRGFAVGFYTEE